MRERDDESVPTTRPRMNINKGLIIRANRNIDPKKIIPFNNKHCTTRTRSLLERTKRTRQRWNESASTSPRHPAVYTWARTLISDFMFEMATGEYLVNEQSMHKYFMVINQKNRSGGEYASHSTMGAGSRAKCTN